MPLRGNQEDEAPSCNRVDYWFQFFSWTKELRPIILFIHVPRAEEVGHKAGDRIAVVVGRYGGESIIDLDHVALIEVDKL